MAADSFKKGSVEMLALLLLCEGDCHGYQIVQTIKERSTERLTIQEGSLYPVLYRLSDTGYISAKEEMVKTKTGRSRIRVNYHIEPSGKLRLEELKREYDSVHAGINQIFESSVMFNEGKCRG